MTFRWRETHQQLTGAGSVGQLTAEASDDLFARRPKVAQATTAVSRQSRTLDDETAPREHARELAQGHELAEGHEPVRRRQERTGYRLVPATVAFWYAGPDRLHRGLRYDRAVERPAGLGPPAAPALTEDP